MIIQALKRTIKSSMLFFVWQSIEKHVLHLRPAEVIELPDRPVDDLGQLTFGSHNIHTRAQFSSVAYQSGFQISQFCFRPTPRRWQNHSGKNNSRKNWNQRHADIWREKCLTSALLALYKFHSGSLMILFNLVAMSGIELYVWWRYSSYASQSIVAVEKILGRKVAPYWCVSWLHSPEESLASNNSYGCQKLAAQSHNTFSLKSAQNKGFRDQWKQPDGINTTCSCVFCRS